MDLFIELAPKHYEQLRSRIPGPSAAHRFLSRATRIDYSIEGIVFEGYSFPCKVDQTGILLEACERYCPENLPDIQQAIRLARR